MIVLQRESELGAISLLESYLRDMDSDDHELLDIYEEIDTEVYILETQYNDYIENHESAESELEELEDNIEKLIEDFKKLNRDEILEELKRIVF